MSMFEQVVTFATSDTFDAAIAYRIGDREEDKLLRALRAKFPQASIRPEGKRVIVESEGERVIVRLQIRSKA